MFGLIKKIFGAIFAFIRGLLGGGKQLPAPSPNAEIKASNNAQLSPEQEILAAVRAAQGETPQVQAQRQAEIKQTYATEAEPAKVAQGDQSASNSKASADQSKVVQTAAQPPKAQPAPVAVAEPQQAEATPQTSSTAAALNMPEPKVTTFNNFSNFGDRRRPGANMDTFLKMARQVRTSS